MNTVSNIRPEQSRLRITLRLEPLSKELSLKNSKLSAMGFDATFWTIELSQILVIDRFKPYDFMPEYYFSAHKEGQIEIEIPKATFFLLEMGARELGLPMEEFIPFLCQYLHCASCCHPLDLPAPTQIEKNRNWWYRAGASYKPTSASHTAQTRRRRKWWRNQHAKL